VASGRFTSTRPGRRPGVYGLRGLHHQALVAALSSLGEDSVEVLRISRLLEPRSRYGGFRPSPRVLGRGSTAHRESPASTTAGRRDQNHRHFAPSSLSTCLRPSPAAARRSGARGQSRWAKTCRRNSTIVTDNRNVFDSSGNAPGRLFEVAREKLDSRRWRCSWQRTPSYFSSVHTVPAPIRSTLQPRFRRAREHEPNGLKRVNRAGFASRPACNRRRSRRCRL